MSWSPPVETRQSALSALVAPGEEWDVLILTRKTNEQIHIGEDIVITVCHISDSRVKIGLKAPSGIKIRRGELKKIAIESPSVRMETVEPTAKKTEHRGPLSGRFSRPRLLIG